LGNYKFSQDLGIQIIVQDLIILRSNKKASGFQLTAEHIHFFRPKWRLTLKNPEFLDARHASGKMFKYIKKLEIKRIETGIQPSNGWTREEDEEVATSPIGASPRNASGKISAPGCLLCAKRDLGVYLIG